MVDGEATATAQTQGLSDPGRQKVQQRRARPLTLGPEQIKSGPLSVPREDKCHREAPWKSSKIGKPNSSRRK